MKPEHYADDAAAVFTTQRKAIRRECIEGAFAALLTAALGAWIFVMPVDWPHATAFVFFHLTLTLVSSVLIVRNGVMEADALRAVSVS